MICRNQLRVTHFKIFNINHRQKITGQTVKRKRLRRTESSQTNTTKHMRPKEQEKHHNGNPHINRKKTSKKNEPIHKLTYAGQNGTRTKKRDKDRICRYCDAPNWNRSHKCTDRDVIYHNCKKKGHFAKVCRPEQRKRKEINELTEAAETQESSTGRSKFILTGINHLNDRRNQITKTKKIDGTKKEFIVDTGSLVKIIPPDKEIIKDINILPATKKYQDANKNEVKIPGKITVEGESKGNRKHLSMFITEREDIKSIFGMDWLREFNWTIRLIEKTTTQIGQSERRNFFYKI